MPAARTSTAFYVFGLAILPTLAFVGLPHRREPAGTPMTCAADLITANWTVFPSRPGPMLLS